MIEKQHFFLDMIDNNTFKSEHQANMLFIKNLTNQVGGGGVEKIDINRMNNVDNVTLNISSNSDDNDLLEALNLTSPYNFVSNEQIMWSKDISPKEVILQTSDPNTNVKVNITNIDTVNTEQTNKKPTMVRSQTENINPGKIYDRHSLYTAYPDFSHPSRLNVAHIDQGTALYHGSPHRVISPFHIKLHDGKSQYVSFFSPNPDLSKDYIQNCSMKSPEGYLHEFYAKTAINTLYVVSSYDYGKEWTPEYITKKFCNEWSEEFKEHFDGIALYHPKKNQSNPNKTEFEVEYALCPRTVMEKLLYVGREDVCDLVRKYERNTNLHDN